MRAFVLGIAVGRRHVVRRPTRSLSALAARLPRRELVRVLRRDMRNTAHTQKTDRMRVLTRSCSTSILHTLFPADMSVTYVFSPTDRPTMARTGTGEHVKWDEQRDAVTISRCTRPHTAAALSKYASTVHVCELERFEYVTGDANGEHWPHYFAIMRL